MGTVTTWCQSCGCNPELACACARGCAKHPPFAITIPGKFDGFFSGSAVGQGQWENYSRDPSLAEGAHVLYERYRDAYYRRAGKGYSKTLDHLTRAAVEVLADYADACIDANSDDGDHAEKAAAVKVLNACHELIRQATGG